MTHDSTGQAGASKDKEIEITPAMIEAGAKVLELYDVRTAVAWDRLAIEIFRSMQKSH